MSFKQFWNLLEHEEVKLENRLHHYHRRHHYHRLGMAISAILTIVTLASFSALYLQTSVASTTMLFTQVVFNQTASPATPTSSALTSNQNNNLSPILTPPPQTATKPAVSFVVALEENQEAVTGGEITDRTGQNAIPVITEARPRFAGRIALAHAIVLLELHSPPPEALTTTIETDQDGNWSWQTPEALSAGLHILYIKIFDEKLQAQLAQSVLYFIVSASEQAASQPPTSPLPSRPAPSFFDQGKLLFDIRVVIPDQYQVIHPGEDLLVQFNLVNASFNGKPADVGIRYRIINQTGTVVLEQSETLAVALRQSFVRTFNTAFRLPAGDYQLEAALVYPTGETTAVSAAGFKVTEPPVLALSGGAKLNVNLVLQGLGLLLTVFALITYYEFKQVEGLAKIIHQISEKDLLNKGLIDKKP